MRFACLIASMALALAACAGPGSGTPPTESSSAPPQEAEPDAPFTRLTCGGRHSFDIEALDRPGAAELGEDPAAVALRTHLTEGGIETEWLPDAGWIEASRAGADVLYLAPGEGGTLYFATAEAAGDQWRISGWGGCNPQPDLPLGVNLANFRIAPDAALDAATTEIEVLVTERECNSGQDARGRIMPPQVITAPDSITVLMTVRARGGGQTCPSNPETPFLLELPEPLGDRTLLDGSSVPPRDAMTCPQEGLCP